MKIADLLFLSLNQLVIIPRQDAVSEYVAQLTLNESREPVRVFPVQDLPEPVTPSRHMQSKLSATSLISSMILSSGVGVTLIN